MTRSFAKLRDDALVLRDVGYVFVGINGRIFRFGLAEFSRLKQQAGLPGGAEHVETLPSILETCSGAAESAQSFEAAELMSFGPPSDQESWA